MGKGTANKLTAPVKIFGKVYIHLSFFILIALALFFNYIKPLLAMYIILFFHEAAHIITARMRKIEICAIEWYPFGACIKLKTSTVRNPADEGIIAVSGPLANFIISLICHILIRYRVIPLDAGMYIISASIIMGTVNLLPVLPLDGGRILKAFMVEKLGYIKAYGRLKIISKITAVLLFIAGITAIYYTKFNFSLLIISAFVGGNLISEQNGYSLTLMREMIFSRKKLEENGIIPTAHITITEDTPARNALRLLSYHKYYLINIVDKKGEIIKTVTETRLMESLVNKNIKIKGKEI